MNAINLYIQTCRYVMQAQANDSSTWEDLYRYLPFLRQALSCCVCSNIIECPMGPVNSKCQHHVCRECRGGKMRLRSSCSWCKNWQEYVENNQLRLIVQCFKKLCDYLASSVIAQHLRNNNSASDSNSILSIITEGRTVADDYSFSPSGPSVIPCLLPSKISATSNGTSLVPIKQELVDITTGSSSGGDNPQLHDSGYNTTTASIKKEDCDDDVTDTDSTLHTTPPVPDDTQPNHVLLSPVLEAEEPAKVTSTSSPDPPENITDDLVTSSSAGVVVPNNDDRFQQQQQSSVDSDAAGLDEGDEAGEGDNEEEEEDEEQNAEEDDEIDDTLKFGPLVIADQNGVFPNAEQEEEEAEAEEVEEEKDNYEKTQNPELVVILPRMEHIAHLEHSHNLATTTVAAVDDSGGVSVSGIVSISRDIDISSSGGGGQPLSCSSSEAASSGPNSPVYEPYSVGGHATASTSERDYNKDTYTGIYSVSMSNDHAPKLKIRRTSYLLGPDHHRELEPSLHRHHHPQQHKQHHTSGSGSTTEHKQKSRSKPPRQKTKPKGCRCGLATPTPGKLTCCGQRCPCYSAFKGCLLECRCRGCRNPRKVQNLGGELPKLTMSKEVVQEDEEEETDEESDDEDSDIEVDL